MPAVDPRWQLKLDKVPVVVGLLTWRLAEGPIETRGDEATPQTALMTGRGLWSDGRTSGAGLSSHERPFDGWRGAAELALSEAEGGRTCSLSPWAHRTSHPHRRAGLGVDFAFPV
jgi:hypothetical protein